ncbi:MAG: putative periplasmic/secreted protein [Acidobacteria bacterium]|nr:putative periplasmic/secreted protein [Acidobacteriota bacterium]
MHESLLMKRNLPADLLIGAVAGAAATWLMDLATTALYERQPDEVTKREDDARGGKAAYEVAAEKAAGLAGRELTEDERKRAGSAIHWALGVSSGVMYGALRHAMPRMGIGSGIAYGAAFWLLMDEAALTLMGLTPPPKDFPWQTHARGLAGHLVLGATIEAAFDAAAAIDSE